MANEVEENPNSALLVSIGEKIPESSRRPFSTDTTSIYKVPEFIRHGDKNAYEPQVVSIGPYHRNKESLKGMNEHKWRYAQAILERNPEKLLKDYLEKIKDSENDARSNYSETAEILGNEFVEIMFRDGCFIVELFLKKYESRGQKNESGDDKKNESADDKKTERVDDIIALDRLLMQHLSSDLILLENQLPYFILEYIIDVAMSNKSNHPSLEELAVEFFRDNILKSHTNLGMNETFVHLLHLVHFHLSPVSQSVSNPSTPPSNSPQAKNTNSPLSSLCIHLTKTSAGQESKRIRSIPSATKLHEAGVKFKKAEEGGSLLKIKFDKKNGIIEIPYLFIGDSTNLVFRNLIAFEQCYQVENVGTKFSIYAELMDCIVNTPRDVEILCRNRIIEHGLGRDEEVALLFNRMCKGILVNFRDTYLSGLFEDVMEYYGSPYHEWRAGLVHRYFSSPWAIVSLAAAILLLLLTIVQTFFCIFSYVRPPS